MVSKSYSLGSKITQKEKLKCDRKEEMDQFGYHALPCKAKSAMTKRHDAICAKLFHFCQLANLDVQQEQRYENDNNNNKVRIEGRPSDIKINNYYTETTLPKNVKNRDLYIDVTVANVCADTYIKQVSKKRAVIAQSKEKHKLKKYQNNPKIMGIGMEAYDTIST